MKKFLLKVIEKILVAFFATVGMIVFTIIFFIAAVFNFIAGIPI